MSSYETVQSAVAAVGIASVQIVEAAPLSAPRREIILENTSPGLQRISLNFAQSIPAVVGNPPNLGPGQVYQDVESPGHTVYQGPIQAISNLAGGTLGIFIR